MKHAFAVRMALGDPGPEYDLDHSSTTTNASALAASRFANMSDVLADVQNATWVDMLRWGARLTVRYGTVRNLELRWYSRAHLCTLPPYESYLLRGAALAATLILHC